MKILFLGDSITDSDHCFTDDGLGNGYVKRIDLLSDKNHIIVNGGSDGFTFSRTLEKYLHFYEKQQYDVVVLTCGINDVSIMEETELSDFEKSNYLSHLKDALCQIIEHLHNNRTNQIVLVEPLLFYKPAWREKWKNSLARVRTVIKQTEELYENVSVLELQNLLDEMALKNGIDSVTVDGIHLMQDAEQLLAEQLYKVIENTL